MRTSKTSDDDEIVAASSNDDNRHQQVDGTDSDVVSKKDALLYFLCGIASDAIPGFFFSSTIINALNLPNEDPTKMSIYNQFAGVLGTLRGPSNIIAKNCTAIHTAINCNTQFQYRNFSTSAIQLIDC